MEDLKVFHYLKSKKTSLSAMLKLMTLSGLMKMERKNGKLFYKATALRASLTTIALKALRLMKLNQVKSATLLYLMALKEKNYQTTLKKLV